ncbi:hypothetical protein GGR50DRAFT_678786 [Xylaria sp. CBS 124048]|nr:hypothetical protein GGR50DRAFT_678786 [Xylaria sp. CBS 124048]
MLQPRTAIMSQSFRPTQAVKEDDARRRRQVETPQVASRALLSKNWRKKEESEVRSQVPFTPRRSSCVRSRAGNTMTTKDVHLRQAVGMSLRYRGDPTVATNRSAAILDSENTSLWVMGLPAEAATYHGLMDLLAGRGKILATNIVHATSHFQTAAAAITFFRHKDAENVMRAINDGTLRASTDRPVIEDRARNTDDSDAYLNNKNWNDYGCSLHSPRRGLTPIDLDTEQTSSTADIPSEIAPREAPKRRLSARWNRVRVAEPKIRCRNARNRFGHSRLPCRVVHVSGRKEDVNPESLEAYFSSKFRYHLDRVICHGGQNDDLIEYEYRFASWRNQVRFFFFSFFFFFFFSLHPLMTYTGPVFNLLIPVPPFAPWDPESSMIGVVSFRG